MAELSRLLAVKKEAEASLQDVERIIYETEEAYFNECTSGNAIKGWSDYIEAEERAAVESVEREATSTSRLPRKRDERKRKMADENRLFSYGSYFFNAAAGSAGAQPPALGFYPVDVPPPPSSRLKKVGQCRHAISHHARGTASVSLLCLRSAVATSCPHCHP